MHAGNIQSAEAKRSGQLRKKCIPE